MLKRAFMRMPWWKHRLLSSYRESDVVKTRLKIVGFQIVVHQVAQKETRRKFEKLIKEDGRSTISGIVLRLRVSYGICQRILREELKMWQIPARYVLRLLTDGQNQFLTAKNDYDFTSSLLAPLAPYNLWTSFLECSWNSGIITDRPNPHSQNSAPAVTPGVVDTFNPSHKSEENYLK
jgi:hypothetical protein